jgi:hypothetical protein
MNDENIPLLSMEYSKKFGYYFEVIFTVFVIIFFSILFLASGFSVPGSLIALLISAAIIIISCWYLIKLLKRVDIQVYQTFAIINGNKFKLNELDFKVKYYMGPKFVEIYQNERILANFPIYSFLRIPIVEVDPFKVRKFFEEIESGDMPLKMVDNGTFVKDQKLQSIVGLVAILILILPIIILAILSN